VRGHAEDRHLPGAGFDHDYYSGDIDWIKISHG
jgi:hypothetical protein